MNILMGNQASLTWLKIFESRRRFELPSEAQSTIGTQNFLFFQVGSFHPL